MLISYLKDRPELAAQLMPGLVDHWRYVYPEDTATARAARLRTHESYDTLPIAWIAHEGEIAMGMAALRVTDLEGREDLGPWLGCLYTAPRFRGQGIASQLCRVVEAKAAELAVPELYLFTHGQEALYERLGWSHFEATIWHGYQCSIMSKVPSAV